MAEVTTQYDGEIQTLLQQAHRIEERIGLLNRLRELVLEESGQVSTKVTRAATPATTTAAVAASTEETPKKKRGRPRIVKPETGNDEKRIDLPTLLQTISQQVAKPLVLGDFVKLVREANYPTKAKDISNMVYQALLKLVKRGKFKKNDETRAYEYVEAA